MMRFVRVLVCVGMSLMGGIAQGASRPNIVFFLADDLGATDLGCYGSTFYETPRIDELCRSGMKFSRAYAACPVCSPTRASILTGKYPARVGITDYIPGLDSKGRALQTPEDLHELPPEETTLAETLSEHGYNNHYIGKWHLGKTSTPLTNGFATMYSPGDRMINADGKPNFKGLTPRLADDGVRFINEQTDDAPFLLYFAFHDPHIPLYEYEDSIAHFRDKAKSLPVCDPKTISERNGVTRLVQDNPAYASMIKAVDTAVGRILDALTAKGFDDNTIVIFTSDNGGLSTLAKPGTTANVPLRAGKGWLYEGGIRVPTIVRAPGVTKASSSCDLNIISTDFYPTLLELAGLDLLPQQHVDGKSFQYLLTGNCPDPRTICFARPLVWHYPHYHGSTWAPGSAILGGPYKLIHFYEDSTYEFYDLANDPGERLDISDRNPELKEQMIQQLHVLLDRQHAQFPIPRSNSDQP